MYKVLKAPGTGGSVYTIAPVQDLNRVKHVHRSLVKGKVDRAADYSPSEPPERMGPIPAEESSLDGDWAAVISEPTAAQGDHSLARPALIPLLSNRADATTTSQPVEDRVTSTANAATSGPNEVSLRRTNRPNAGTHPNPHHLPQAAGSSAIGAADSLRPVLSSSVLFRPWQ